MILYLKKKANAMIAFISAWLITIQFQGGKRTKGERCMTGIYSGVYQRVNVSWITTWPFEIHLKIRKS
jgi:hypothetical protein